MTILTLIGAGRSFVHRARRCVAARLGVRTAPGLNIRNWCWPKLARAPTRPPLVDEKQWAGIEAADSCLGEISRSSAREFRQARERRRRSLGFGGKGRRGRGKERRTQGLIPRENRTCAKLAEVVAPQARPKSLRGGWGRLRRMGPAGQRHGGESRCARGVTYMWGRGQRSSVRQDSQGNRCEIGAERLTNWAHLSAPVSQQQEKMGRAGLEGCYWAEGRGKMAQHTVTLFLFPFSVSFLSYL